MEKGKAAKKSNSISLMEKLENSAPQLDTNSC